MEGFSTFKGFWPWPWIGSYCIPSCITHRPLPTCQISLKSKKHFVDGPTDVRIWTDGHLRPTLLGRLRRVNLNTALAECDNISPDSKCYMWQKSDLWWVLWADSSDRPVWVDATAATWCCRSNNFFISLTWLADSTPCTSPSADNSSCPLQLAIATARVSKRYRVLTNLAKWNYLSFPDPVNNFFPYNYNVKTRCYEPPYQPFRYLSCSNAELQNIFSRSKVTGSTHACHCVTQPNYATVTKN